MAAVIETLRDEHRNIGRLLDALEHQVAVFARAETPDYDVISGIADYFLDFPDLCHHPKENVIYQRLSEKHPQEAARIGDLLLEHKAVHDHAVRFRDTVQ